MLACGINTTWFKTYLYNKLRCALRTEGLSDNSCFFIKHNFNVEYFILYYISVIFHSASKQQQPFLPDRDSEGITATHTSRFESCFNTTWWSNLNFQSPLRSTSHAVPFLPLCSAVMVKIRRLRFWSLQMGEIKTSISSFCWFIIFSPFCVTHISLLRRVCAQQERQIWVRQKNTWTISWGMYRIQHVPHQQFHHFLKLEVKKIEKTSSVLSWNKAQSAHFWVQNEY